MTTQAEKVIQQQVQSQEIIVADLEREYLQAQKVADDAQKRLKEGQSSLRALKSAAKAAEASKSQE